MSSQLPADYRPDIDGLRAIAILSILFFHTGFYAGFQGGYVGVDIFFVISGYLITKNIVNDLKYGTFSFKTFYIRRARRLLPALLFTLALSFISGFLILSPQRFEEMAGAALSSLFSMANFFYIGKIGYFKIISFSQPLLHTWALSIEEQFIILWPLTLFPLFRLPKNLVIKAIISVISLAYLLSLILATLFEGSISSYYFTPFRVYEFMAGAILVFVPAISSKRVCEAVFILGSSMMAFSIAHYSSKMQFPSYYALLPTAGAALVIAANNPVFAGRLLNNPLMIFIGRISYSLYLVHWPIKVFMINLKLGYQDNSGIYIVILSFILSTFMYFYIERPFRDNNWGFLYRSFFRIVPVTFFLIAILSLSVWIDKGWTWRYSDNEVPYDGGNPKELSDTLDKFYKSQNVLTAPLQQPGRKNVLLVGDSQSMDYFFALAANRDLIPNINLYHIYLPGACFLKSKPLYSPTLARRIIPKRYIDPQPDCAKAIKDVLDSPFSKSADMVIVATHITTLGQAAYLPEEIKFHRGYSGAEIVIAGPKLMPFNPAVRYMMEADSRTINKISYNFDRLDYIKLNQDLKAISEREGARYFDIDTMVCNNHDRLCRLVDDQGFLLFRDDHHWSLQGEKYFGKMMIKNGLLGK